MSNQPSELDFDDAVEMMKGMFPNLEEELIQQYIMEYRKSSRSPSRLESERDHRQVGAGVGGT